MLFYINLLKDLVIFLRGKMENIAVFAHFDKDNLIDDYVIYYLKELKKVSEKIIFVSDCNLSKAELVKLDGIVDFHIAQKHGEYDFGSYKRGYNLAKEKGFLATAKTLSFVNDSCYGPFESLESIYKKMNAKDCDFWGLTGNNNYLEGKYYPCEESNNKHVQSYFLVFKNQVFNSKIFDDFISSISHIDNKFKIIELYEIGLTTKLCQSGFKYCCFFKNDIGTLNLKDILCKDEKPFVFMKVSLLKEVYFIKLLKTFIKKIKCNYDPTILINNLKRIRCFKQFKFKYFRKQVIRIHFNENRIFIFGRWFGYEK